MARYTNMGSPNQTELEGFKTGLAKGVCYLQAHMFERCQGCRLEHMCIWCHSTDHKLSVLCCLASYTKQLFVAFYYFHLFLLVVFIGRRVAHIWDGEQLNAIRQKLAINEVHEDVAGEGR